MVALLALAILAPTEVILGGQKQIILGLKPEPTQVMSYFIWMESKENEFGSSTNTFAQRLGYSASKVKADVFNNQHVFLFDTDGRTKQDVKKEFDAGVGASERAWIAQDGHIMRQIFTVVMPKTGERTVEAIYGTKTVELTVTEGGKETATTLFVDGGCQNFFDRFKPMVVDGKVVLKEKKFSVLDPYKLSILSGTAVVGGRFEQLIGLRKMRGNFYNVTLDGKRQRIYLTDKNDLVKVDLTDETYLQSDVLPDQ